MGKERSLLPPLARSPEIGFSLRARDAEMIRQKRRTRRIADALSRALRYKRAFLYAFDALLLVNRRQPLLVSLFSTVPFVRGEA